MPAPYTTLRLTGAPGSPWASFAGKTEAVTLPPGPDIRLGNVGGLRLMPGAGLRLKQGRSLRVVRSPRE